MKQEKIFVAYKLLEKLNKTPLLPFKVCSKLYGLKKSLAPYYEAQIEKEHVLFEEAGIDENGNVLVTPALRKAIADIMKTDIDFSPEAVKIELTADDMTKLEITAEIMEQLEDFVEFVEV